MWKSLKIVNWTKHAELASFWTNTQQGKFLKPSNIFLQCNYGRMFCTWLNLGSGLQMQCIKPQEFLLQIWVLRKQSVFINLSCSHVLEMIFGRISDFILLCISLWRRLYTNLLHSTGEYCFHCVRYTTFSQVPAQWISSI